MLISGTPTGGGLFNFTVSVIDDGGNTGSRNYALTIIVPITVNPASLPNGTTGTPYNQTVTASGGTGPYTFAVSAGALPTGLALNANSGAITGTPTVAGPFNFTIQATDNDRQHRHAAPTTVNDRRRAADDQSGEPAGRAAWARRTTRPSSPAAAPGPTAMR